MTRTMTRSEASLHLATFVGDRPYKAQYTSPNGEDWLVNLYFWRDGDHWAKYAHLGFKTEQEAQAYIEAHETRPNII